MAEEKAQIGKRTAEHGVAANVRYCSRKYMYHGRMIKDSSVRTWRNKYLEELKMKRESGKDKAKKELPNRKEAVRFY